MLAFLAAVGALALLTVLPGPDFAITVRWAIAGGRRAGFMAILGIQVGILIWGALAVAGLAALFAASPDRVHGGQARRGRATWSGWRRGSSGAACVASRRRPNWPLSASGRTAFRQGLLTNLLNPKIAAFYVGVLPALVPAGAPPALTMAAARAVPRRPGRRLARHLHGRGGAAGAACSGAPPSGAGSTGSRASCCSVSRRGSRSTRARPSRAPRHAVVRTARSTSAPVSGSASLACRPLRRPTWPSWISMMRSACAAIRGIVGRHDGRDTALMHERRDQRHHRLGVRAVELAGRLVGDEQTRVVGEGARDARAAAADRPRARPVAGSRAGRGRRSRAARRRACRARRPAAPRMRIGSSTFSAADSTGSRAKVWKM